VVDPLVLGEIAVRRPSITAIESPEPMFHTSTPLSLCQAATCSLSGLRATTGDPFETPPSLAAPRLGSSVATSVRSSAFHTKTSPDHETAATIVPSEGDGDVDRDAHALPRMRPSRSSPGVVPPRCRS
jgi:hypothetical protein